MSIRTIAVAAGLAAAIGITALFGSFAVSDTAAAAGVAGASNFAIERTIPNYVLRWENPMLPLQPVAPILGQ